MSLLDKINGLKPAAAEPPPQMELPPAATPISPGIPDGIHAGLRASPFNEAGLPKPRVYNVNDIIRLPNYKGLGGFRVWKITGIYHGILGHETTVGLRPLDLEPDVEEMHVPAILFEACGFEVL